MKKSRLLFCLGLVIPVLASCGGGGGGNNNKIVVHFDLNNVHELETTIPEDITLLSPNFIDEPTVVVTGDNPDNYDVRYWCTDKALTTPWDFDEEVTKSMTLYASWEKRHKINYYQAANGQEATRIYSTSVWDGETLKKREELQDTYEDLGYYYNYDNKAFKEEDKIDFTQDIKVTKDMDIYLQKSEYLYISGGAIRRRFIGKAATGASDTGKIDLKTDSEGNEFAEVKFGRTDATSGRDPYILITNPALDVTKSQKIEITMRNLGPANKLAFYWVGKWADGTWIDGKESWKGGGSFIEEHAYHFNNGYQRYQKETDPWTTYTIPVCETLNNGVSTWGAAFRITALRIQSTIEQSEDEDNNILQIKSIKGIYDSQYAGEYDTTVVKKYCKDDAEADIEAAAKKQSNKEHGFILPKNNEEVSLTTTDKAKDTKLYYKTTGTGAFGKRADGEYSMVFTPTEREISLKGEDGLVLSTLEIYYLNYGYVGSMKVEVNYKNSKDQNRSETKEVSIATRNDTKSDITNISPLKINLHKKGLDMVILNYIKVTLTPIGVDNAVKFYSLEFLPREQVKIVGENFDDTLCSGFSAGTGAQLAYEPLDAATKVTISASNSYISKSSLSIDLLAYNELEFSYNRPSGSSITKATIEFTLDDGKKNAIEFPIASGSDTKTRSFDWLDESKGYTSYTVTSIKITFEGTGIIYLSYLKYILPDTSINMATKEYIDSARSVDRKRLTNLQYDSNELALKNIATGETSPRFYFAADTGGTSDGHPVYNFSLKGKHKLVVVYCNMTDNEYCEFRLGGTSINDPDYKTKANEPKIALYDGGPTGLEITAGANKIHKKMAQGQWASLVVDLPDSVTGNNGYDCPECFIDMCFFIMNITTANNLYIRAYSLI